MQDDAQLSGMPVPSPSGGRVLPSVAPLPVRTTTIILAGVALWTVALVLTLVVPAWHTEDRSWWPWACVSGLALGLVGLAYVRRGRGNAAET